MVAQILEAFGENALILGTPKGRYALTIEQYPVATRGDRFGVNYSDLLFLRVHGVKDL